MYCVRCGVELGEKEEFCPLCGAKVHDPDEVDRLLSACREEKQQPAPERATIRYIKNRYIAIARFCIFMSMLVLFIVNLSVNGGLNWSLYPLSVLALLWFCMIFPVKYSHKFHPVILVSACVGAASLFLVAIDLLTGFLGWSLIALYSAAYACLAVSIPLLAKIRVKHIISILAAVTGLYLFALDLQIGFTGWSLYAAGGIALLWCFAMLPMYLKGSFSALLSLIADTLAVTLFLFVVLQANGAGAEFLSLALPIAMSVCLPAIITCALSKAAKFSPYGIISLSSFSVAAACLLINLFVNLNLGASPLFNEWSVIAASCCAAIGALLLAIEKSKRFKEYLNKKLNV